MKEQYELVTCFFPSYSSISEKEMYSYLKKIGIEDYMTGDSFVTEDREYFLEWKDSGHERDSSNDVLYIWKKK